MNSESVCVDFTEETDVNREAASERSGEILENIAFIGKLFAVMAAIVLFYGYIWS